jgi:hypothetical protein
LARRVIGSTVLLLIIFSDDALSAYRERANVKSAVYR